MASTARSQAAAASAATARRVLRSRGTRLAAAMTGGLAAAGLAATLAAPAASAATSAAQQTTNCSATPSACGYPDATSTGVPAGTAMKNVPAQATSGTGWTWNATTQTVVVTGAGATLTGLNIAGTLDIDASNVTVNKVAVTSGGGGLGIALRHTTGVTIQNSTITGTNTDAGRLGSAIDDPYGDSTGMVISNNNIADFKTAVQVTTGQITGNYIHSPGFVSGDHTNGILDVGTTQPLTISHNTILITLGQTDAISLDATGSGQTIANKTVTNNLLGGGSYALYGGTTNGNTISNITITGNDFSQASFAKSGQYGPVAYFTTAGTGNTWSANTWDTTGQPVPAP